MCKVTVIQPLLSKIKALIKGGFKDGAQTCEWEQSQAATCWQHGASASLSFQLTKEALFVNVGIKVKDTLSRLNVCSLQSVNVV